MIWYILLKWQLVVSNPLIWVNCWLSTNQKCSICSGTGHRQLKLDHIINSRKMGNCVSLLLIFGSLSWLLLMLQYRSLTSQLSFPSWRRSKAVTYFRQAGFLWHGIIACTLSAVACCQYFCPYLLESIILHTLQVPNIQNTHRTDTKGLGCLFLDISFPTHTVWR